MKLLLFLTILCIERCASFTNVYGNIKAEHFDGDPGVPLILTPLIKQNKIQLAQKLSEVHFDELENLTSHAGYLTVNEKHNSNLFFWFFPSQSDYVNDPVVLWLQGGPGATSMIGLFTENGPIIINKQGHLKSRRYSWTRGHSVIYIDNPVGTGYSFTDEGGYAQNETAVGNDLYVALLQFFQLFPQLQTNDFFVTGESYAGKYVPAISYTIHQNNPTARQKINLKGLSMGNGLSDPENQLKYGDYLYQIGLVDSTAKKLIQVYEEVAARCIEKEDYLGAFKIFDELLNGDLTKYPSFFKNVTGFSNYFNYLVAVDTSKDIERMGTFIQSTKTRSAIHVGNASFNSEDNIVEKHLEGDVMKSVAPWISILLSNYRVLIYNGQLDIIVAYPLTINYLEKLQFSGDDIYKTAERHQWYVNHLLAGYVKQAGNLTEVLVRNAGHMVPTDQPAWAFDLITRFTRNKSYY